MPNSCLIFGASCWNMPEYSVITALTAGAINLVICPAASWTSPAIPKLRAIIPNLSTEEESWLSSLVPLGAVLGPYFAGYLADKIGRKYTIACLSLPITASYLLITFYKTLPVLYVARFISGLSMGGSFAVLPAYVGEVSAVKDRGYLGATMTVFIASGLCLSFVIGPFLSLRLFNIVLATLPLIFFVMFIILGVESPYFYVSIGDMKRAKETLGKLRNSTATMINDEVSEIKFITEQTKDATIWDIFRSKPLLKAEIICAASVFFHQGTGINAILSNSQEIFEEAGASLSPEIASLVCGLMLVSATFVSIILIHKFKRRIMMILSLIGIILSLGLLGIYLCLQERNIYLTTLSFIPLVCLIFYSVTFNLGLGPLAILFQGEFFPTDLRASTGALNSSFCWLISFLVTKYFQPVAEVLGLGECFLILTGVAVLGLIFFSCCLLETKDKSLKQIQDELNK